MGAVYIIVGLAGVSMSGKEAIEGKSLTFGLATITALIYVGAITSISIAFLPHTNANVKIAVIAAITAMYPAITALAELIFERQPLSIPQLLWLIVALGGIIGLSFSRSG